MSYPGPGDITQVSQDWQRPGVLGNGPRTGPPPSALGGRAFTLEARKPSVPGHLHPCPLASETLVMTTRVDREVRGHRLPGPLVRVEGVRAGEA